MFKYDHILRLENGQPIGRVILRYEEDYKPLQDFCAVLVKIPKCFELKYNGMDVWIDSNRYKFPDLIDARKVKSRDTDDVISHLEITYTGENND